MIIKVFPPHARPGANAEERLNSGLASFAWLPRCPQPVCPDSAMFSRPNVVWDTLMMLHPRDFDGIFPSDGFSNHFDGICLIFPSDVQSINPYGLIQVNVYRKLINHMIFSYFFSSEFSLIWRFSTSLSPTKNREIFGRKNSPTSPSPGSEPLRGSCHWRPRRTSCRCLQAETWCYDATEKI